MTTVLDGTSTKVSYQYDALNRRIARYVDNGANGSIENTQLMVNHGKRSDRDNAGDSLALILDGDGKVTNRYLYGALVDEVLAEETLQYDANNNVTSDVLWALSDHQGSVRDWAKIGSEVSVVKHVDYDPFGNVIDTQATNAAIATMFGYTGRSIDPLTKLQDNRARPYDPTLGRFISQDPMGFDAGDANLYRMVGNHPSYATDPSGLAEWGSYSKVFREYSESAQKAGNPFGHAYYGILSVPIALIDTVPFDIADKAAASRRDIRKAIETTNAPVLAGVGTAMLPVNYAGEFVAQFGNTTAVSAPVLILGTQVPAIGAVLSSTEVVVAFSVPSTYQSLMTAIEHAENGDLTGSDVAYVFMSASPLFAKGGQRRAYSTADDAPQKHSRVEDGKNRFSKLLDKIPYTVSIDRSVVYAGSTLGGLGGIKIQPKAPVKPDLRGLTDEAAATLGKGTRYKSTSVGEYTDGSLGVASSDTLVPRVQREWAQSKGVRVVNGEGHAELTIKNGATEQSGPLVRFEIDSPHGRNAANPNGQMCKDCAVDATSGGATTSATSSGRASRKRK